jgi:hypothetical protein
VKTPANKNGLTVNLDSSTGYKALTMANNAVSLADGSISDVKTGNNLVVEVVPGSLASTFAAKAVVVLPGKVK